MFDISKIKEGALAALAALVLTSTAVAAAVGPGTAEASPVVYAAAGGADTLRG